MLSSAQCWGVFDVMMADHRFAFMREPRDMEPHFRHAMRGAAASPKLWQDAYLAAFALAAGLHLVTFDAGFRQFAGVDLDVLR